MDHEASEVAAAEETRRAWAGLLAAAQRAGYAAHDLAALYLLSDGQVDWVGLADARGGDPVKPLYTSDGWIPFATDGGGNSLAADLAPEPGGSVGVALYPLETGDGMTDWTEPRLTADGGLPAYDDLPPAPRGGRSAWGLFGPEDGFGLLNLQTPERVATAARLVRSGEVYSLNAPVTVPEPPLFRRGAVRHTLLTIGSAGFDDKLDNFYPQASSQWDSLAHIGYGADQFYNGVTAQDVTDRQRNTIGHWAERGIAGRGVLLDIDALLGGAGDGFDPASPRAVTAAELDAAREAAGIQWQPGDVLLLHTGFLGWHVRQPAAARQAMAERGALRSVGLAHDEEMARYLWNAHVAAVVADNPAVEVWPADSGAEAFPFGFLHQVLIGQFGLALGELWWLDDLARACRQDGRHEVFLTAAPLNLPGGIGSPANALAFK
ncbi:MAG TPA: cyclase family protein [Trebonia sp.]